MFKQESQDLRDFNPPQKRKSSGDVTYVFIVAFCAGLLVFILELVCYSRLLFYHRNVVFILTAMCVGGSLATLSLSGRNVLGLPTGISTLVAVIVGALLGVFCFDNWGYFTFMYRNLRTYQDVVPSQPAAAVADAGVLVFSREAYVDQEKSVGTEVAGGRRYCAAPIRDEGNSTHVEFWAVGVECCGWIGSFDCQAVNGAHGAAVVLDSPGVFTVTRSDREYFDKARTKAQAMYDLNSVAHPMYVRWIAGGLSSSVAGHFSTRTWTFNLLSSVGYAALSAPALWFLSQKHCERYYRPGGRGRRVF